MSEDKKVLVVDDDPDAREYVKAILETEGYAVITAENGRQGVEKAQSEKPDIVILDVMMPEMDGYDACEELKGDDSTSATPVILLTAVAEHVRTTKYSHRQGMETDADDYIPKPVEPEVLLAAVRRLTT